MQFMEEQTWSLPVEDSKGHVKVEDSAKEPSERLADKECLWTFLVSRVSYRKRESCSANWFHL